MMTESCFTDPKHQPTSQEIRTALGFCFPLWDRLTSFIENSYQIQGTWSTWGPAESGWNLRYRRKGKTLAALHPQQERILAQLEARGGARGSIKKVREFIEDWTTLVEQSAPPGQSDMFGGAPPTKDELAARWRVSKQWLYKQTMLKGEDAIPRVKVGKYLRFESQKADAWLLSQQSH